MIEEKTTGMNIRTGWCGKHKVPQTEKMKVGSPDVKAGGKV